MGLGEWACEVLQVRGAKVQQHVRNGSEHKLVNAEYERWDPLTSHGGLRKNVPQGKISYQGVSNDTVLG